MKIVRDQGQEYRLVRIYPFLSQDDSTDYHFHIEILQYRNYEPNVKLGGYGGYVDLTLLYDALIVARNIYADWIT